MVCLAHNHSFTVDGAWHLKRIEIRSAPIETPKKKTKAVVFVANDWVDIEGVTLSAIGISIPVKRDAVSPVSGRSTPANRLSPDHLPSGDQSPAQTPQRVPSWDHITAQSLSTLQEFVLGMPCAVRNSPVTTEF